MGVDSQLKPGTYTLTLWVKGKQVDTDEITVVKCPVPPIVVVPDPPSYVDRCEPADGSVVDGVTIPAE